MIDHVELLRSAFDLHYDKCAICNGTTTDRFCPVGKRLWDRWITDETTFGNDLKETP